jgi:hypothetical protein
MRCLTGAANSMMSSAARQMEINERRRRESNAVVGTAQEFSSPKVNSPAAQPRPWAVKRTGSTIGVVDANKKYVIRKVVNMLTIDEYKQLSANFEFVVDVVNKADGL